MCTLSARALAQLLYLDGKASHKIDSSSFFKRNDFIYNREGRYLRHQKTPKNSRDYGEGNSEKIYRSNENKVLDYRLR